MDSRRVANSSGSPEEKLLDNKLIIFNITNPAKKYTYHFLQPASVSVSKKSV